MQRHGRGLGDWLPPSFIQLRMSSSTSLTPLRPERRRFMQRRQLGLKHTLRVSELRRATHQEMAAG